MMCLSVFIVIGVGSDMLFVYTDFYKQSLFFSCRKLRQWKWSDVGKPTCLQLRCWGYFQRSQSTDWSSPICRRVVRIPVRRLLFFFPRRWGYLKVWHMHNMNIIWWDINRNPISSNFQQWFLLTSIPRPPLLLQPQPLPRPCPSSPTWLLSWDLSENSVSSWVSVCRPQDVEILWSNFLGKAWRAQSVYSCQSNLRDPRCWGGLHLFWHGPS